jgi:hypothetical protein
MDAIDDRWMALWMDGWMDGWMFIYLIVGKGKGKDAQEHRLV